eukprot:4402306-Amphidinium_carterae.1
MMIKRYIRDHKEVKETAIGEALKLMQDNSNATALIPYAEKKMLAAVGQDKAADYAKFKCLIALIRGQEVERLFDDEAEEPIPAAEANEANENPDVLSGPTENTE